MERAFKEAEAELARTQEHVIDCAAVLVWQEAELDLVETVAADKKQVAEHAAEMAGSDTPRKSEDEQKQDEELDEERRQAEDLVAQAFVDHGQAMDEQMAAEQKLEEAMQASRAAQRVLKGAADAYTAHARMMRSTRTPTAVTVGERALEEAGGGSTGAPARLSPSPLAVSGTLGRFDKARSLYATGDMAVASLGGSHAASAAKPGGGSLPVRERVLPKLKEETLLRVAGGGIGAGERFVDLLDVDDTARVSVEGTGRASLPEERPQQEVRTWGQVPKSAFFGKVPVATLTLGNSVKLLKPDMKPEVTLVLRAAHLLAGKLMIKAPNGTDEATLVHFMRALDGKPQDKSGAQKVKTALEAFTNVKDRMTVPAGLLDEHHKEEVRNGARLTLDKLLGVWKNCVPSGDNDAIYQAVTVALSGDPTMESFWRRFCAVFPEFSAWQKAMQRPFVEGSVYPFTVLPTGGSTAHGRYVMAVLLLLQAVQPMRDVSATVLGTRSALLERWSTAYGKTLALPIKEGADFAGLLAALQEAAGMMQEMAIPAPSQGWLDFLGDANNGIMGPGIMEEIRERVLLRYPAELREAEAGAGDARVAGVMEKLGAHKGKLFPWSELTLEEFAALARWAIELRPGNAMDARLEVRALWAPKRVGADDDGDAGNVVSAGSMGAGAGGNGAGAGGNGGSGNGVGAGGNGGSGSDAGGTGSRKPRATAPHCVRCFAFAKAPFSHEQSDCSAEMETWNGVVVLVAENGAVYASKKRQDGGGAVPPRGELGYLLPHGASQQEAPPQGSSFEEDAALEVPQ